MILFTFIFGTYLLICFILNTFAHMAVIRIRAIVVSVTMPWDANLFIFILRVICKTFALKCYRWMKNLPIRIWYSLIKNVSDLILFCWKVFFNYLLNLYNHQRIYNNQAYRHSENVFYNLHRLDIQSLCLQDCYN